MEQALLKVEHIHKYYGKLHAINDVSLEVRPGEIVGLLGHNGAGKSTLIKCLMGVIQSYTGKICIAGKNIRNNHEAIRENAGFLLEPAFCDYLSARDNLKLLNSLSCNPDPSRVEQVLELVSLLKHADKKVGDYSFGMRERLGLAHVLLTQPHLIVLDEPTVGLDPLGVEIVKNLLVDCSKKGMAVLFSSHQLTDVLGICHRAVVMNEGTIVYDGPASDLTKTQYAIRIGCNLGLHTFALLQLDPAVSVIDNVIYFDRADILNKVLVYLVEHELPVEDVNLDSSMDGLKKLML